MRFSTFSSFFLLYSCFLPILPPAAASDLIPLDSEDEEIAALSPISSDEEVLETEWKPENMQYADTRRRSGSTPLLIQKGMAMPKKDKFGSQEIFLETPYPLRRFALELRSPKTTHAEKAETED